MQNAIFTALSRNGTNLFLVGDVKQSIYRFRLADPTIFLGKYRAFADYTRAAEGEERRLILSRNFRSRPEVLEGANFVFRNVMSADFGEMDYTADEALYPGAPFPPDGRYAVELDLSLIHISWRRSCAHPSSSLFPPEAGPSPRRSPARRK